MFEIVLAVGQKNVVALLELGERAAMERRCNLLNRYLAPELRAHWWARKVVS